MNAADIERLYAWRQYLRPSEYWEAWLAGSGEEPPDLDALPAIPNLPEPLHGSVEVREAAQWPVRRAEILNAFKRYVIGAYPEPPEPIEARTLAELPGSNGASVREVELSFGPGRRAKLHLELCLPPGAGPFPVFMTQRNHAGWARIALARGYAAVVYNACDSTDDTQAYKEIWPGHDWSMLCRRAWAAGRALDWLRTLPAIDRERACITGHSRNGKQALICGAIDARFGVVISSSSGIGGASPYRLANEAHFSEGIEILTHSFPEWFHPRLRFFAGREDRLPVDANLLLALSAPRAVLISTALNDPCESVRANELPEPKPLAVRAPQTLEAWSAGRADRERRMRLLLGAEPPTAERLDAKKYGLDRPHLFALLHRPVVSEAQGLERHDFSFGQYIPASLYAPHGAMHPWTTAALGQRFRRPCMPRCAPRRGSERVCSPQRRPERGEKN